MKRTIRRLDLPWRAVLLLAASSLAGSAGAAEPSADTVPGPALTRPPLNFSPGSEYADAARMFQGIPSIERAANGRLWATWYGGGRGEGAENYVMLNTSGDDGRTWSPLKLVIDPPFRASEPGLWHDPQGRLWLMWNQYPQGLTNPDSQMWALVSENSGDENPTWSPPRLIAQGLHCFNKPVVLGDGTWLWPSGSWAKSEPSRPLLSRDNGQTFVPGGPIVVPQGRNFDEYNVVQLGDGRLWLLCRAAEVGAVESFSSDRGRTWTVAAPSPIKHTGSRHFLTRLRSGKLLLVKHGAIDERTPKRSLLSAFLSADDGQTWSAGLMLDERNSVTYPDGVESPEGAIYVIYDCHRITDKQILLARFTEADIAAGKLVSDGSRLRVVVNQALQMQPIQPVSPEKQAKRDKLRAAAAAARGQKP